MQVAPAGAVDAGSLVTYTLRITNTGPGLARSVDVKDQLPPGLSLERITAEGGVCAGPLCQFGNLPVDSTRTVTVVARVSSAVPAGVITNTAGVFSPDAPVVTKTVTTQITTAARLSASKVALNSPVNAGEVAFFQVVVANQGPSDAQAVHRDRYAPGRAYLCRAATRPAPPTAARSSVRWAACRPAVYVRCSSRGAPPRR